MKRKIYDKPFCVRGNASSPVKGMRFENIKGTIKGGKAFDIAHAPDIVLEDVDVAVDFADGE